MASENQEKDNNKLETPLWKKILLPLGIFIGGMSVVVVLAFVLIPGFGLQKGLLSLGPSDYPSPDSFEAPAEVSVAVQMDCQASIEKINQIESCEDRAKEFISKGEICVSYDYTLESHQYIKTDGKYGDVAFVIADCMLKQNPSSSKDVVEFLKKVKEYPDWDLTIGAASCDSKASLESYITALSSEDKFKCNKKEEVNSLISKVNSGDLDILDDYISTAHIPQFGQLDADTDMSCPDSVINLKNILKKIISAKGQINQNLEEKSLDANSLYLDLVLNGDHKALMRFNYDDRGCMYLDSVSAASIDKSEDSE